MTLDATKTSEEIVEELERTKWKRVGKELLKDWRLYLLLLPLLIFMFMFKYLPIKGVLQAFKFNDEGITVMNDSWFGLMYVKQLFQNNDFWRALRNTFVNSMYGLVFGFPIPIFLALLFSEEKFDINSIIKKPLVVSENLETLELLKEFKENKEYVHMALAVDEFGSVEGLITLNDLLEGIVGDIPGIDETDDPMATQRLDGTWLIDGRFQIDKFKELFDYEKEFPYEKEDQYTTIAGFILSLSGKIPDEKEIYDWDRFHFEILDIDGHQIDKILVTDLGPQEEETEEVEE